MYYAVLLMLVIAGGAFVICVIVVALGLFFLHRSVTLDVSFSRSFFNSTRNWLLTDLLALTIGSHANSLCQTVLLVKYIYIV